MKVGIFLGTQHPASADMRQQFEGHLEQTQVIRDCGYDSLWLSQHYLTFPYQFFQTIPLLGRLAAESGDMTIGTNIFVLPLHNVIDIAEQFATLDIISNGRLIFGAALGYRDIEYNNFGINRKTRAARFEEQIDALKMLWEQDNATYQGKHVKFENISIRPKPMQKPRPPIWLGATAEPAIKRAALKGDAWIATQDATVATMKNQVALYHQTRIVAALTAQVEFARCVELFVAETREKAFANSAPHIAEKYRTYHAWGAGNNVQGMSTAALSIEDLIKDRFIIGDPEDCVRKCIEQRDLLRVTHLLVRLNFPGIPQQDVLKAFRLFAKEVLPHIR